MEPKNCTCTTYTEVSKSTTIKVKDEIGVLGDWVTNVERGVWGYGGKRDKIPMNDAARAEAELQGTVGGRGYCGLESKETLGNRGSHRKDSDWVICWDSCRDSGDKAVILRMSFEFDGEGAESNIVTEAPRCDG